MNFKGTYTLHCDLFCIYAKISNMKKTLLVILVSCNAVIYAQQYINVGSTKSDVKKVQGNPYSIQNYDALGEEVWSYGENGIATITFKNGEVKSFKNSEMVLKIGNISKKTQKELSKEFWKKANSKENPHVPKDPNTYGEDKSGLYGSGGKSINTFPKEYAEMTEANGLSAYEMPNEITLQEKQKEYDTNKTIKWGLISLGIIGFLFLIFKLKTKKK